MATATTGAPLLEARGLGKCYDLGPSRVRRLARLLAGVPTSRSASSRAKWALREATFDVAPGGSLGVIGRNGSGKSTLLRLLAGTARPSEGSVRRSGRHASLLDLGIGFNALETGHQNAETALILQAGLSRTAARRCLDEVEAFADIGDFFRRPIRVYSDGMRLRLAFATITVLEPDVLITDEILVVGDEEFQGKCRRWFEGYLGRGGSLVLCAHDLAQVQQLCSRTLWLDDGCTIELGPSRAVIQDYRRAMGAVGAEPSHAGSLHAPGAVAGLPFEVADLHLVDDQGHEVRTVRQDADVVVIADVVAHAAAPQIFIGITTEDLTPVYGLASDMDGAEPEPLGGGRHRYRLRFDRLALCTGRYRLRAHALDETGTRLYDTVEIHFVVEGDDPGQGLVRFPGAWQPAERT